MDHLDHARHARGGLGVADVRLDGAEEQRGRAVLAVGGEQGLGLDRVAQGGAGAVGLDDVHIGRRQARGGEGRADHALLGRAVRGGEAVGGAVLVDRGAADHGEDLVAVAQGVGLTFQDQQTHAL
ncbi:hypothetical protein GCM10010178_24880 [Lentzea flava]|uniref:Uncharacterized protein n=1 Tax=Lentzea flava TaxID=103732 RepID=A0ABQ2UGB7_9PSEU|nr:hypothetical protein GCM10010178_24880 [Lentzea flava]